MYLVVCRVLTKQKPHNQRQCVYSATNVNHYCVHQPDVTNSCFCTFCSRYCVFSDFTGLQSLSGESKLYNAYALRIIETMAL